MPRFLDLGVGGGIYPNQPLALGPLYQINTESRAESLRMSSILGLETVIDTHGSQSRIRIDTDIIHFMNFDWMSVTKYAIFIILLRSSFTLTTSTLLCTLDKALLNFPRKLLICMIVIGSGSLYTSWWSARFLEEWNELETNHLISESSG